MPMESLSVNLALIEKSRILPRTTKILRIINLIKAKRNGTLAQPNGSEQPMYYVIDAALLAPLDFGRGPPISCWNP